MFDVGLIGYGAFGHALMSWLEPYCSFHIYDQHQSVGTAREALRQPIIVLAIPAQFLEEFLSDKRALLNPSALYIDVCSVKVEPAEIMERLLPADSSIIATHPAFGPESAKDGLAGQKIMVYPVRCNDTLFETFLRFITGLELHIIETTPQAHDQAMAYIQGLSHYVGRIMQALAITDYALSTQAYRDLLDMKNVQGNDSDDLFRSIVHNNGYTEQVLADFKEAMRHVDDMFHL